MAALTQDLKTASVAQLVLTAQGGQRDAFGELFERFQGRVQTLALRRLRDWNEAQELCQEVFLQALQKISQLRQPECFAAWLRSTTNRLAINRLRRSRESAADPETLDAACVEDDTPLSILLTEERQAKVRAGLDRLRDGDRQTLQAFYVDGKSLREMSDQFDAPLGTIKRRLHTARTRLAKQVESLIAV
jgi:RNA polymerase sigma-70 factor, ECF subfamily